MEIIIFVLRTVFLVLIYVFVFIFLIHLIRDLRDTGTQPAGAAVTIPETGKPAGWKAGARHGNNTGLLKVDTAPAEYGLEGAMYELAGETRLGRGAENDVVLPDRYASNQHAVIQLRNGQYWLEDLGSRNGTYLNGKPLTGSAAVLAHGDQIRIGDIIFSFVRWEHEVEYDHRVRTGTLEK